MDKVAATAAAHTRHMPVVAPLDQRL